jgi:outer membrane protein assembly factor BamB
MIKFIARLVLMSTFLVCSPAMAKVGDLTPIVEGNIVYRSHANYVEALKKDSQKVLWKTELYPNVHPEKYNPLLEKDVQWNIIQKLELHGRLIRGVDSKGKVYCLDKNTGKIQKR